MMDFKWRVRNKQDIQKFIQNQLQFELAGMAHLAWLSNRMVMRSGVESWLLF